MESSRSRPLDRRSERLLIPLSRVRGWACLTVVGGAVDFLLMHVDGLAQWVSF